MSHHADVLIIVTPLDLPPDAIGRAAALLSPDERQRAAAFTRACDTRRFIAARARLRELLASRLSVRPAEVGLAYGRAGKPRLAPRFGDGVAFNVSHCGDLAAIAIASGHEVGVDIETVRALPDADHVAAIAFSWRERRDYRALAPHERAQGFFNCWTRKEAFVKALGNGLRYPLHAFDVSLAPGEPARLRRVGRTQGSRLGWALHAFAPCPNVIGALAVAHPAGCDAPRVFVRTDARSLRDLTS